MEKSFHMMVFRVFQSQRNQIRPRMHEIGLSTGQPKILLYVRDHENCRLKDVAAYCDIKPATTSRIIEKLLEGGFLTRTLPKDDRRAMCLQITDEGKTALEQWIGCCHEAEEMMLENFSEEERRQFFSFLSRAYDNLNQSKGGKIA